MSGRLVVCPTPIGNLDDVTLRVLRVLGEADLIACEDTRRTRVLLERHGVVGGGRLVSYHEHNERARAAELVERIGSGAVVALVSDAGMPGVSDPGWLLVRGCAEAGARVEVLPGASAVPAAVVVSALPAGRWRFVGFLPRRAGDLTGMWDAAETTVAFESPQRLGKSLASLAATDPARPVAVCRELTKVHEEVVRGSAHALAERYAAAAPRGEIVVVFGAAGRAAPELCAATAAVRRLVDAGARTRPAASVVAELTGTSANALYRALTAGD